MESWLKHRRCVSDTLTSCQMLLTQPVSEHSESRNAEQCPHGLCVMLLSSQLFQPALPTVMFAQDGWQGSGVEWPVIGNNEIDYPVGLNSDLDLYQLQLKKESYVVGPKTRTGKDLPWFL